MKLFLVASLIAISLGAYALHNYTSQTEADKYAARVRDIVNKVNSSNTTWKAEVPNKFIGRTKETMKAFFMRSELFMNKPKSANLKSFAPHEKAAAPESFDSRTNWPKCDSLKEIRDQSACGSCWAFGAAETMSDRVCIASGQTDQRRVSAENILSCCTSCGFGCQGGYPAAAFDFWMQTGIVTGGLYGDNTMCQPYKFSPCAHHVPAGKYPACPSGEYDTPTCSHQCVNGADYSGDKIYAKSSYTVGGEDDMKTEIAAHGPVEVAFTVYEDFPTYKSGVYQHVTGEALGGHAVKMIGWGEEEGTPYWIIINSWNETWGDNGQFKILRGRNHCGIEDEGAAGEPRL